MQILALAVALVSSASFAADCGRVNGTPGFIVKDTVMAIAKAKAKGECEGYMHYSGLAGSCSDMGCVESQGVYTCTAMITVCR
jgi:hypothetical protein